MKIQSLNIFAIRTKGTFCSILNSHYLRSIIYTTCCVVGTSQARKNLHCLAQVRALATKTKPVASVSPTPHTSVGELGAPLSLISKNKSSKNKSTIVAMVPKGPTYVNADIQKADILNDNDGKSGIYK